MDRPYVKYLCSHDFVYILVYIFTSKKTSFSRSYRHYFTVMLSSGIGLEICPLYLICCLSLEVNLD